MTPNGDMERDLHRDEAWFRERCVDRGGPNTEALKARVRLAVQEEWLARTVRDQVPGALAARSRSAVRQAVSAERGSTNRADRPAGRRARHRRLGPFGWIGGLTAAAACVALLIGVRHRAAQATVDLSYVEAFESFNDDSLTASLARLGDEVGAMDVVVSDLGLGEIKGFEWDETGTGELTPQGDRTTGDGSSHRG